ncbi:MAG TPA: ATP-binding protein, partial [Sphingobacteriaceae bacterium]
MIFKNYQVKLGVRIALLAGNIALISFLVLNNNYNFLYLAIPVLGLQLADLFNNQIRVYRELEEFSEAMFYKDFSRHFDVSRSPAELQPLRHCFNDITDTFKRISREKETHYHYLRHILEIVGTGILSFEVETGTIAWMNDAVKQMLNLPEFKTIHALEKRNKDLYRELETIRIGESKIYTAVVNQQAIKILLSSTMFQI